MENKRNYAGAALSFLMKVVASAPGNVKIFGEHAIVYGKPAISMAINRRCRVSVEKRGDDRVVVRSKGRFSDYTVIKIDNEVTLISNRRNAFFKYVEVAVEKIFNYLDDSCGISLIIDSDLPEAAGLASSAAVTVATIVSLSKLLGYELSREEVSKLGHEVEVEVQGAASKMDTLMATYGGLLYITPDSFKRIDRELRFIVINSKEKRSTKDLVAKVRMLRNKYPEIFKSIIDAIGKVVEKGRKALIYGGDEEVGYLMNINHGLLESLGVSTPKLNEIVHVTRELGALGSKLTGAGGGGCIIAYAPMREHYVLEEIKKLKYSSFLANVTEGVKVESCEVRG